MSSFERMKNRLNYKGYDMADNRIVNNKNKSFQITKKRSYQAEWITFKDQRYRCLISPSRLTEEFDQKILSIDFDAGLHEGDTFFWDRTGLYWVVNAQQHTEEAYFKAKITRAEFEIEIDGETYWAIQRGPTETETLWREKHNTSYNELNLSIALTIVKNTKTIDYFTRHKIIEVTQYVHNDQDDTLEKRKHNWRVVATDKYSEERTMQVYIDEYFDNPNKEKQMPPHIQQDEISTPRIIGPDIIHPFDENITYTVADYPGTGYWSYERVDKKVQENIRMIDITEDSITISSVTAKSLTFYLLFVDKETEERIEKKIIVE